MAEKHEAGTFIGHDKVGGTSPRIVQQAEPPTAAPGLSARVLGGSCAACGKPRDAHGAPAPGDPLGCTGVPFSLSVPEAMVTIRKPASLGHTAALPPVEEPQWVTCDCLRTAHLYSGSCRGVVRSVPAPDPEPIDERALYRAVQLAARDLPDGFQIHVSVERGSGWVSLEYPGVPFEYRPDGGGCRSKILDCVAKAKATPVVDR
jgi:hypothetical protein